MCVCENMRNAACSFIVSSSRTALQEQMNSSETKILFSCKYPSVIKYPGNKNDRKMYEVQAELFLEQCVSHGASVAPYSLGCGGTRGCAGSGSVSSGMGQGAASAAHGIREPLREEKMLLLNCSFRAEMIFSAPILWQGNPFVQGWEEAALSYCEGRFSELQIWSFSSFCLK